MSMEFRNSIDREDIMLDSEKLKEFNNKSRLVSKVEEIKHKFIDENDLDLEGVNTICKFAEEIKMNIL